MSIRNGDKPGERLADKLSKLGRRIEGIQFIVLSIAFGLLLWVIDAILDFFIFHPIPHRFFGFSGFFSNLYKKAD